jgi:hypothetical protein
VAVALLQRRLAKPSRDEVEQARLVVRVGIVELPPPLPERVELRMRLLGRDQQRAQPVSQRARPRTEREPALLRLEGAAVREREHLTQPRELSLQLGLG